MLQKVIGLALLTAGTLCAQGAADAWAPLRFLMGTWEAKGKGAGVEGTGWYAFQTDLKDHVLVRRSGTKDCKGPADFNCDHSDVLYVYPGTGPGVYRAIYFDNEGHVIHYDVTVSGMSAVMLSDAKLPGPQFRLVYERKGDVMNGKFEMKPPGQTEWRSYLEWSGGKR